MTWENIKMIVVIVGAAVLVTFCLAKPIGAYQMGSICQKYWCQCKSVEGHDDSFIKPSVCLRDGICGTDLLCRNCSAASGEDGDKNSAPDYPDSGVFLCGAVVTLFCDGIARTVFAPTEISISSVTALFLVPVVIAAMLRKQEGR